MLPRQVVASLLRVRELELNRNHHTLHPENNDFWVVESAESLDNEKERLPSLLDANKVEEYPFSVKSSDCRENKKTRRAIYPRVSDLMEEIHDQTQNAEEEICSFVLAGEGEPTLRWNDLLSLADQLSRSLPDSTSIRLTTNGLVPTIDGSNSKNNAAQLLQSHGISHVSVALMSADPLQYDDLMQPLVKNAHSQVCQFIEQALETTDLKVEVTAVDRAEVDKVQLESLAESLRVPSVRWRPYFA